MVNVEYDERVICKGKIVAGGIGADRPFFNNHPTKHTDFTRRPFTLAPYLFTRQKGWAAQT